MMMKNLALWLCVAALSVSLASCEKKSSEAKLDPQLEKELS